MLPPADIRADICLNTDQHDALIELAILSVEFMSIGVPEHVVRARVGRVVLDYPEIDRELFRQRCRLPEVA